MNRLLLITLALSQLASIAAGAGIKLTLPTSNNWLFEGEPEKFYMYCDRNFEGKRSKPWTAGQYGYVRNMKRTPAGVIGTRLHEGVDIQSVKRNKRREPLDQVHPIAPGRVAYVNASSGRSNYGKYVVVLHDTEYGEFYSLYAHFNKVSCEKNQVVDRNSNLGTLGYTGRGTTRTRAHLHLEFGLVCSDRYNDYLRSVGGGTNYHGNFNGLNLIGCDIARLLIASRDKASLDLPTELAKEPVYFKVTVPRRGELSLVRRNPYLTDRLQSPPSPSWEISFTAAGFPLKVMPSRRAVTAPRVSWVKPQNCQHSDRSLGRLSGVGSSATLTARGLRFVKLMTGDFPAGTPGN